MTIHQKTGVLVGRFQTPELHDGHLKVIKEVAELSDHVVFILGESPTKFTNRYPLSFDLRIQMMSTQLRYLIDQFSFRKLNDCRDNIKWSANLDKLLEGLPNVTLYCSRDGFKSSYSGEYPVVELEEVPGISATQIRTELEPIDSIDFRSGIIYAVENRFPIVYPTVDIAVIKMLPELILRHQVLLGRKPNETQYRFPGGFVDKIDASLEDAACRELREEAGDFMTHEIKYVGSFPVSDWRYRGTKDSIMTTLFMTYYMGGTPKAGDDLAEVKWFSLDEALSVIVEEHLPLLQKVIDKIS